MTGVRSIRRHESSYIHSANYTGARRFTRVDLLGATESDEGTVALDED